MAQEPRLPQRLPSLALPERTTPLYYISQGRTDQVRPDKSPGWGAYKLDDMGCDDARGCGDDGDDDCGEAMRRGGEW